MPNTHSFNEETWKTSFTSCEERGPTTEKTSHTGFRKSKELRFQHIKILYSSRKTEETSHTGFQNRNELD